MLNLNTIGMKLNVRMLLKPNIEEKNIRKDRKKEGRREKGRRGD